MQALILSEKDRPLRYASFPDPVVEEGKAIVHLKAAALNHRDVWITKGLYPGIVYPIILGSDGAGMYEGREVIINPANGWGDNPRVQSSGFHILGLPANGTFAEKVLVSRDKIHPKPAHLSWYEAAALPLGGLTAYRALFSRCGLKAGEQVLISGAGGGVALFACQFAIAAGARVYVTSGSDHKIQKAVEMGALGGANYKEENWAKAFEKQTGGFDVIIDSAGGKGFESLVRLARPGGRICFYGGTRGNIPNLNPQIVFWKQLSILGSTMGTDEEFRDMLAFVEQHHICPVVDEVFPLSEGDRAFEKMDKGLQFGKIVLDIASTKEG